MLNSLFPWGKKRSEQMRFFCSFRQSDSTFLKHTSYTVRAYTWKPHLVEPIRQIGQDHFAPSAILLNSPCSSPVVSFNARLSLRGIIKRSFCCDRLNGCTVNSQFDAWPNFALVRRQNPASWIVDIFACFDHKFGSAVTYFVNFTSIFRIIAVMILNHFVQRQLPRPLS